MCNLWKTKSSHLKFSGASLKSEKILKCAFEFFRKSRSFINNGKIKRIWLQGFFRNQNTIHLGWYYETFKATFKIRHFDVIIILKGKRIEKEVK